MPEKSFSPTTGIFWALCGLLLIFVMLWLRLLLGDPDAYHINVSLRLMEALGAATMIFGLFNVVLQTRSMREYFENHMTSVVTSDTYLEKLSQKRLKSIQKKILRKQLGANDPSGDSDPAQFDRSFAGYFHKELHDLVSQPYRENVEDEWIVELSGPGKLLVKDNISYTCKKVGGKMQDRVEWSLEDNELEGFESLSIALRLPLGTDRTRNDSASEKIIYNPSKEELKSKIENYGKIEEPIPKDYQVDGVKVIIRSVYRVSRNQFHHWEMINATNGFCFILRFPYSLELQTWAFVQSEERLEITNEPGYQKIRYDSWMLPNNGVAWLFSESAESSAGPSP